MPKALQLHQIRMIQRSHPAPPRQNLIPIEVRLDQPYHRRRTRPIRCRKKRTPALRPYQFCKWVDPANRSPFILCPKIHGSLPSWELSTKEENAQRAKQISQTRKTYPDEPGTPFTSTHYQPSRVEPSTHPHQTKFTFF